MPRAASSHPAKVALELDALPLGSSRLFIEHRSEPRIGVRGGLASFASLLEDGFSEGDAILVNVSLQGCQLESEQMLPKDHPYQVIVYVPPHPSPILIHKAVTQWSQGRIHGIRFLDLASASKLKLQEAVRHGPASSWVLNTIRFSIWSCCPSLDFR